MTNPHGSLPDLSIVICFISFGIVAHFLSNGKRKNNDFRNRPPIELPPPAQNSRLELNRGFCENVSRRIGAGTHSGHRFVERRNFPPENRCKNF
jgi:cbb3-type cytochrome oxidase subunit 3